MAPASFPRRPVEQKICSIKRDWDKQSRDYLHVHVYVYGEITHTQSKLYKTYAVTQCFMLLAAWCIASKSILYNRKFLYPPYFRTISYTSHIVRKLGRYKNLSQLSFEPLLYMYAAHSLPCRSSCTKISTVRKTCLWLCKKFFMPENLLLYSKTPSTSKAL